MSKDLPPAPRLFGRVYVAALCASLVVAALAHHAGLPRTHWDPLSDPFMGDLMEYPGTFQLLHSRAFFDNTSPTSIPSSMFSAVAYPPFASVLFAPLYLSGYASSIFVAVAMAWLAVVLWQLSLALRRAGLARSVALVLLLFLALTSFPVLRLLHQGNIELVVWIFAATGTYAFLRGHYRLAAVLWGLAAAVKLYPLLLLTLLAPRRRSALGWGLATFLVTSCLSLWWLGPNPAIAFRGSIANIFGYQHLRTAEWSLQELVANHSAFSLVKLWAQITHTSASRFTVPYYLGGLLVFLFAFFVRLAWMPFTNQLLGVTVYMLLLPTVSYYHTLVHLYAPFSMLLFVALQAHRSKVAIAGLRTSLLLFIPLFMPYTLCTFPGVLLFCGLIQLSALMVLFLCALQYPFPDVTEPRKGVISAERWRHPAPQHPTLAVPRVH